jgi:IS6 family transposase
VSIFSGRHFPKEVILWAVRWYCRYGVSYRDLEEMLTERGVAVDHTTIYRWVQRYAPELDKQTRWYRRVSEMESAVVAGRGNLPPDRREVVLFVSGGHLPR